MYVSISSDTPTHLYIKGLSIIIVSLCRWHVWCLCPVTSPAGCRCHWLSVFRCRGHCRASYLIQRPSVAEQRSRACADQPRGRGRGCSVSQSGPGQTGNGLLNIIWNVDMIQTQGNSGGRSERPGSGDTVTSVWPGWGERGPIWSLVMGNSDTWPEWGSGDSAIVILAKIVNKWTHKHGALWGEWVSLPQIRLRLGHCLTGQGVFVEIEKLGSEKCCQESN